MYISRLHIYLGLLLIFTLVPANALINVRFTPVNLYNEATTIQQVNIGPVCDDEVLPLAIVQTIKGPAGVALKINKGTEDLGDALLAAGPTDALLVLGDFSKAANGGNGEQMAGALYAGLTWFGLEKGEGGAITLVRDPFDLSAVWAGSAGMLARAFVRLGQDSNYDIPAKVGVTWEKDINIGQVKGTVNGIEAIDLWGSGTPAVFVRSSVGDRLFHMETGTRVVTDMTATMGLNSRSSLAAWGDFDGDGHLDLASWDGKELGLQLQRTPGVFTPGATMPVTDCRGLSAVGDSVVVATATTPNIVTLTPEGKLTSTLLPAGEALGEAGVCMVLDVTGDSRADILQFCANGVRRYPAAGNAYGAPTTMAPLKLGQPTIAKAIDADGDGNIDLLISDGHHLTMMAQSAQGTFTNVWSQTGELDYHTQNIAKVLSAMVCDINNDGRFDVAIASPSGELCYFNRGFRCFGYARDLDWRATDLPGATALVDGQVAGGAGDIDGDGAQDVFGVTKDGAIWAIMRAPETRTIGLTVRTPATCRYPIVITIYDGTRLIGAALTASGAPVFIGKRTKGPLKLTWKYAGAEQMNKTVMVMGAVSVSLPVE